MKFENKKTYLLLCLGEIYLWKRQKNKIVAEHSPAFALFQLEDDGKVLSIDLTHVLNITLTLHELMSRLTKLTTIRKSLFSPRSIGLQQNGEISKVTA